MRTPAAGIPCNLRIASFVPGLKCADPSTCVMNHLPVDGKGTSTKVTDIATVIGCATCHDIIDGRNLDAYNYLMNKYPAAVFERMLKGLVMTHTILIEEGVLQVLDAELILSGPWRP